MLYSGDPYLQNQARLIIERSGAFLNPVNGQLPHHFNGLEAYYLALSGETQTGPNTFWVKTALLYAKTSGDLTWLANYMPTLRNASSFVFDLIDPQMNMVFAPGSLMIDVFIRNNYTSDSNAMVVSFLKDFAEAERAVGNATRATELEATAVAVSDAMNKYLWASAEGSGNDHFITQLNAADGSTRDFVDYDSNLIAVANGVTDEARSRAVFKRVDGGQCSAAGGAGPQFVSEKYYGEDDTTNGNTGDSWCSMGRIAYFDAHARKRLGSVDDLSYFNEKLLQPIQRDLIANTFMHERYGCDGLQQQNRSYTYFEYPATVTILLRDIRYGIKLGLSQVEVSPFGVTDFSYQMGNVNVAYSPSLFSISAPGTGMRQYSVTGMNKGHSFSITVAPECDNTISVSNAISSDTGVLTFNAPIGLAPCVITATAL